MAQPIAPDYGQQFLFPPALEDWVPADHPARFLREFVDQLDLPALGFVMPSASEGRPPYAPSLLLKIWLYGYFHRIRSTRKLEVACLEPLSLIWLTGLIAPDHNSLWRFGNGNQKALRQIFKQSAQLALRTGAVGLVLQAVVDSQEGVIVACEAGRQESDAGQLVPMIEQARETLGVASLDTLTVADTGYGAGADLQAAQEKQLPVLVPPAEGKPAQDNPYASQHFYCDLQARTVTCPQGCLLDWEGHTTEAGQRVERYRCHCPDCAVRAQCTRDPKGRRIEVRPHTAVVQAMRAELETPFGQELYQQRSQ